MAQEILNLLFVTADAAQLASIKQNFADRYQIFSATSAAEASQLLQKENIQIMIASQTLPDGTGVDLFHSIETTFPDLIRVLITDKNDADAIADAANKTHIYRYLKQPFTTDDLAQALADCSNFHSRKTRQKELITKLMRTNEQLEFMLRQKLIY